MFNSILIAILSMIALVATSNYLVQFPINAWLTWGAFTYPATYLVSELINRFYGSKIARQVVYAGFLTAIVLSYTWFDKRVATASCIAFLVSQLLDIAVFSRFRQQSWWFAPVVSSCTACAIDTGIFFSIAFYGTVVPWVTLATGDYFVKLLMDFILLLPFRFFVWRSENKLVFSRKRNLTEG